MKLAEARALLTGASGGIGLAIIHAFCSRGVQVLAVSRNKAPLIPLLARYPGLLQWIEADLATQAGRQHVLMTARAV